MLSPKVSELLKQDVTCAVCHACPTNNEAREELIMCLCVLIFRLDTDILLAGRCGLKSLLVLTGFSTLKEVDMKRSSSSADDHKQVPDFYLQSLADLGPLLG